MRSERQAVARLARLTMSEIRLYGSAVALEASLLQPVFDFPSPRNSSSAAHCAVRVLHSGLHPIPQSAFRISLRNPHSFWGADQ
jgi:hypothetical protein